MLALWPNQRSSTLNSQIVWLWMSVRGLKHPPFLQKNKRSDYHLRRVWQIWLFSQFLKCFAWCYWWVSETIDSFFRMCHNMLMQPEHRIRFFFFLFKSLNTKMSKTLVATEAMRHLLIYFKWLWTKESLPNQLLI